MRTAPALLVILALSLALTGCVPDDDPIVVDPEPSASPIFESDEEALAAAEEALVLYYETSDLVLSEGGVGSERLEFVSSAEIAASEKTSHQQMIDRGWHAVGNTQVDSITLQSFDPYADEGDETVTLYACVDVSGLDIVDTSGASVVSPTRSARTPFEIGFVLKSPGDSSNLVLSRKDAWSGDDFCEL